MPHFVPNQVFVQPDALAYPATQRATSKLKELGVPITITNRVPAAGRELSPAERYRQAKRTLSLRVRKDLNFASCKPSAHYQLPLASSCPGLCEYCYLSTTLGPTPYLRAYVNVEEILSQAEKYIQQRLPAETYFEGAATSDPVPVEYLTGSLAKAIEFFARQSRARFRFVTKFTDIDSLLTIEHGGRTRFRFSINSHQVIENFEHGTPRLKDRIAAANRVLRAGYPLGFLIGPILALKQWEKAYSEMFEALRNGVEGIVDADVTFELITHRFTRRGKALQLAVFPETTLPLEEDERRFKFGQFGYGKFVYPEDAMSRFDEYFTQTIRNMFPRARIEYLV